MHPRVNLPGLSSSPCSHGFGVGPKGIKFKFAQQYLKTLPLHAPAWHLPTFADTTLSHSVELVEQYMLQVVWALPGAL